MLAYLKKRKLNIIFGLSAIILMWLIWIIAYYAVKNDYIIPSFTATVRSFFKCFAEGTFWFALLGTLSRTFLAFIISFALGAVCALLGELSPAFKSFINPFIVIFRTVPTLAIILLLLVWTNAKVAPVIVTVLVLFPMIYAQLSAAIGGIDGGIIQMCDVYSVPKKERLLKIYLPQVSPSVFSQTGANISLGLKVMISGEVLSGAFKSLGGLMQNARNFVEMPRLAALTVVAVLLGLVIDICFSQLRRINRKWEQSND